MCANWPFRFDCTFSVFSSVLMSRFRFAAGPFPVISRVFHTALHKVPAFFRQMQFTGRTCPRYGPNIYVEIF